MFSMGKSLLGLLHFVTWLVFLALLCHLSFM